MTGPECAPWCAGPDDGHRWEQAGDIVCTSTPINHGGIDVLVQRFANRQEDGTTKTFDLAWVKNLTDGDDHLNADLAIGDGSIDAAIRAADGLSQSLREARAVLAGSASGGTAAADPSTPDAIADEAARLGDRLAEIDQMHTSGAILSPTELAIATRDSNALCEAVGAQFAVCHCLNGFPCNHAHMEPGETPRDALLRRLRAAQSDPIGTSPDPTTGEVEHERVGVLTVDVAVLIHHLETTPIPIGVTA